MKLLRRLFGKQSQLRSVSVYLRDGKYFVVTIHGSDGGDPCISAGPVESLALEISPEDLGNAILRGLQRTTHHYRYPRSKDDWQQVTAPLLSAAGCKNWNAFAKQASEVRVDQLDHQFKLLPAVREKASFAPVPDRELELVAPSARSLGDAVAAELAFAARRDGP